jgi:choline monooxygenase
MNIFVNTKPLKNIDKFVNIKHSTITTLDKIKKFIPDVPLDEAYTPSSSWYLDTDIYDLELKNVFKSNWLAITTDSLLTNPGSYISGNIVNQPYVIVKNTDNEINGFYNVCRHHASTILKGSGTTESLVCPYHGWTYNLNGQLTKCTNMKGIKCFNIKSNGLRSINLSKFSNILFFNFTAVSNNELSSIFEPVKNKLEEFNYDPTFSDLVYVGRREYIMDCNWKVFIDNYCDGGYHVPYGHKDLCSNLDMKTYKIEIFDKCSIQSSKASANKTERLGDAIYAYIYPNLMLNRYGPWLDLNIIFPLSVDKCKVIFEWFVDKTYIDNKEFIDNSLKASDKVNQEDIELCGNVMNGLMSDAFDTGRYIPSKEAAAYHFHRLLYNDYLK